MTAELNALVAKQCRLSRDELALICEIFASFEVEAEREDLEEIKWGDALRSKFNGEVRRRVRGYFDDSRSISEMEAA